MSIDVSGFVAAQTAALDAWYADPPQDAPNCEDLAEAVLCEHYCNFRLWNLEDQARRRDLPADRIASIKREIDGWNQRRNDLMEVLDTMVLAVLPQPDCARAEQHSETAGMMIDRLSILALKIHHMRLNAARDDDVELAEECGRKLDTLVVQRDDLASCLRRLLDQCEQGLRYFKLYRQHKAYNDSRLNPALSGRDRSSK